MDKSTQRKLGKQVIELKVGLAGKLPKLTDKEKSAIVRRTNNNDGKS